MIQQACQHTDRLAESLPLLLEAKEVTAMNRSILILLFVPGDDFGASPIIADTSPSRWRDDACSFAFTFLTGDAKPDKRKR